MITPEPAEEQECQECSPDHWDSGHGCINGDQYGFCGDGFCYGMCEYLGRCGCKCHDS